MTQTSVWDVSSFTGTTRYSIGRNPSNALAWGTYVSVYDQFKVNALSITVAFPYVAEVTPFGGAPCRSAVFIYDNDSSAPPATIDTYFAYALSSLMEAKGLQKVTFKLPIAMMSTSGVGTSIISSEWCDCSIPSAVQGLASIAIESLFSSAATAVNVRVYAEWDVTFGHRTG